MSYSPARNSLILTSVAIAGLCIIMLGTAGLLIFRDEVDAIDALRRQSAHNECRTTIQNAEQDEFRHRVYELIYALRAEDYARLDAIVNTALTEEETQHKIDRICPPPTHLMNTRALSIRRRRFCTRCGTPLGVRYEAVPPPLRCVSCELFGDLARMMLETMSLPGGTTP